MPALNEWNSSFSQLPCQSHWCAHQRRRFVFLVSDSRPGVPNMWFKPLSFQRRSPNPSNSPTSVSPPSGVGSHLITSLCFPLTVWIFLYSVCYVTDFPPGSTLLLSISNLSSAYGSYNIHTQICVSLKKLLVSSLQLSLLESSLIDSGMSKRKRSKEVILLNLQASLLPSFP